MTFVTFRVPARRVTLQRMGLVCLLVSRDAEVVRVLRHVLPELRVQLVLIARAEEARDLLKQRKFDAVILDCDEGDNFAGLLQHLRKGQSNRSCIVFALISGGNSRRAFELGSNFVLDKPLSPDRTMRSFRAAHGLMVRERQRYFRCDVDVPVTLESADKTPHEFRLLNVSEGGAALQAGQKLPHGAMVKVSFPLPHTQTRVEAKAQIVWSTDDGRAGIHFLLMPEESREVLASYIARNLEPTQVLVPQRPVGAQTPFLVPRVARR